jgi:hypothetical protein
MLWCFDLFPFQGNDEKEGRLVDLRRRPIVVGESKLVPLFHRLQTPRGNNAVGLYEFCVVEFPVGWTQKAILRAKKVRQKAGTIFGGDGGDGARWHLGQLLSFFRN